MTPKFLVIFLAFFYSGIAHSQSVVFNPMIKDSLAADSISYTLSGYMELNDSLELRVELVQIYPDSLHTVYSMVTGFVNLQPTNTSFQYDATETAFNLPCGVFNNPDLMMHLLLFRDEQQIYETYYK